MKRLTVLPLALLMLIPLSGCNDIEEFFSPSFDDMPASSVAEATEVSRGTISIPLSLGYTGNGIRTAEFQVDGTLGEMRAAFPWEYQWILLTIPVKGLHTVPPQALDRSLASQMPLPVTARIYRTVQAIRCDGPDDYIVIPASASIAFPDSALTVEAWIRFSGAEDETLISTGEESGYSLTVLQSGRVLVTLPNVDTHTSQIIVGTLPLTDGAWYHIAFTYDGTNEMIYLDGMVDTALSSGDLVCFHDWSAPSSDPSTPSAVDPSRAVLLHGVIDELRIWNTARTQEQLMERMNETLSGTESGLVACWDMNGDVLDRTANANNGSVHGRPAFLTTTR